MSEIGENVEELTEEEARHQHPSARFRQKEVHEVGRASAEKITED
jgi:hypothetical protein